MEVTRIEIGHNVSKGFEADDTIIPSERGYRFQFRLVEKLIERLAGYSTVTLYDMSGNVITRDTLRKRGPDGGLDLLIRIAAKSPTATSQVAGKVWKILREIEL